MVKTENPESFHCVTIGRRAQDSLNTFNDSVLEVISTNLKHLWIVAISKKKRRTGPKLWFLQQTLNYCVHSSVHWLRFKLSELRLWILHLPKVSYQFHFFHFDNSWMLAEQRKKSQLHFITFLSLVVARGGGHPLSICPSMYAVRRITWQIGEVQLPFWHVDTSQCKKGHHIKIQDGGHHTYMCKPTTVILWKLCFLVFVLLKLQFLQIIGVAED